MGNYRSLAFRYRKENRYWWFANPSNGYVPPIFSLLTDAEWDIVEQWYADTDSRGSAGEANIPCLSILSGFLEGNGIRNIVQLGHFEGFSTLLLGFMMRRMRFKSSVFSVDISQEVSAYTSEWVRKADLSDYVKIVVDTSDAPYLPERAREYFGAEIMTIFVDSSHQRLHTLRELNLWFPHLRKLGFLFMHDASVYSSEFDGTANGGVLGALNEWLRGKDVANLLINEQIGIKPAQMTYVDGCGLAILQKKLV